MFRRNLLIFPVAALLSACKDSSTPSADYKPQGLGRHDRCHLCGMVIVNYDGPKAEIFLKNVEEPIKFCSTRDAFTFALQPENKRRLMAFFVTDLGKTAWDKPLTEAFIDAKAAFYVIGSRKEGAMGSELVPFSEKSNAERFAKEEGGRVVRFDEVNLNLLNS